MARDSVSFFYVQTARFLAGTADGIPSVQVPHKDAEFAHGWAQSFITFRVLSYSPFSTAVPFWGKTHTQILSSLYPKRDRGSKTRTLLKVPNKSSSISYFQKKRLSLDHISPRTPPFIRHIRIGNIPVLGEIEHWKTIGTPLQGQRPTRPAPYYLTCWFDFCISV